MRFVMKLSKTALIFGAALFLIPNLLFAQHYTQTVLVSNTAPGLGGTPADADLQNPWGLVSSPTSPWWVSNNAGGTTTLYSIDATAGAASKVTRFIVPNAPSQPAAGSPTGVMFNGSPTDFLLAPGVPALFIFVTEDGTVQGWSFNLVDPSHTMIKADNSQVPNAQNGAVYKGATIVEIDGQRFILAANFRSGRIDVFGTNFKQVTNFKQARLSEDAFEDERIPPGFAPFNVQGVGPNIYVTYAKQDPATNNHDPVKPGAPGDGFVDVFDHHGRLLQRLEHGPWFNAPWGVVWATQHFGEFTNTILVGQFQGANSSNVPSVAAFNPVTGRFLGNMLNPDGSPLMINGLWALRFGNDHSAGPATTLFFTAGPDNETNGIFGTLLPIKTDQEGDEQ
jgi:uncharacterized protein (TIGR03118 family)